MPVTDSEGAPDAQRARVADCGGDAVARDHFDRTKALIDEALNGYGHSVRQVCGLVYFQYSGGFCRIGRVYGDSAERSIVVRAA